MEESHKKSNYFSIIAVALFLVVILVSYYKFYVKDSFNVTKQVSCDVFVDSCFVSDCEANDPECDTTTTYKKIVAPSNYAGSDYDSFTCESNSQNCQIITCNSDTVEDGEKCYE